MASEPIVGPFSTFSTRTWVRGSLLTYDSEAKAGCLTVCVDPNRGLVDGYGHGGCCHRLGGTVELEDGVNIDYEAGGTVISIEVIGREVELGDVLLALRWMNEQFIDRGEVTDGG